MKKAVRKADIYAGSSPADIPTYTITETAQYLRIPFTTLRSWVVGRKYPTGLGDRFFKPLIEMAGAGKQASLLSFTNLIEAHVLDATRKVHGVPMPNVRRALDYIQRRLRVVHPLAHIDFQTDGVDLFVKELGALVSVSGEGQMVMREMLALHLQRIERDARGVAERLYPFSRGSRGPAEPKLIVIDPCVAFGRPTLVGTGVPTDVLVERFLAGESYLALADDYSCDPSLIEEAIRSALPRAA